MKRIQEAEHPDSSSTQHSEIFWNIRKLYERYLLQFKRYFTIQMFRIFNFVKFLKRSTPDAHPDGVWSRDHSL